MSKRKWEYTGRGVSVEWEWFVKPLKHRFCTWNAEPDLAQAAWLWPQRVPGRPASTARIAAGYRNLAEAMQKP